MTHTPETLAAKAAEVRQLLLKAAAALEELEVLDAVTVTGGFSLRVGLSPMAGGRSPVSAGWNC